MKLVEFRTFSEMKENAVWLLTEQFRTGSPRPYAVMLTGGTTPLELYRTLQSSPVPVDASLHLLLTDERHVPLESPESNFGKMIPMVRALGVDESGIMRVHTELPLDVAASHYNDAISGFLEEGGRIELGLLGLGADGHVASLFSDQHITQGTGKHAIAVSRKDGPDRVSVTRDLLLQVGSLVFFVAGQEKADVVKKLMRDPQGLVAGRAVSGASHVELWYSPESCASGR